MCTNVPMHMYMPHAHVHMHGRIAQPAGEHTCDGSSVPAILASCPSDQWSADGGRLGSKGM